MPAILERNNDLTAANKKDLATLAAELKGLFESNEEDFWSKMIDISEKEPEQFIELSSEMMRDDVLKDDASLRLLRGSSYLRKAALLVKSQDDQWNDSSLDLIEKSLIDLKAADEFKVKSQTKRKVDDVLEDRIDAAATMLEKYRPGRSIEILEKTKLKYLADRVFISSSLDSRFAPSDEAIKIFSNVYFRPPQVIKSAAIMSKVLGEENNHRIDVGLFEDISPKNAFGEASRLVDIVSLFENGNYTLQFSKTDGKSKGLKQEGQDVSQNSDSSVNNYSTEEYTAQTAQADKKKVANGAYSDLLDKSQAVKDALRSGKYKEVVNNEFVKSVSLWFRVSDVRLRIPVYIGWSIVVGLIIVSFGHERFSNVLSVVLTMAIYVYALGAVGGPLNWILDKVHKIPYSGLLTMPLFTLPWYVFGWPSEKLYSLFFYNFTSLAVGLRYLQDGEYSKALLELENAKVSEKDIEGRKVLYSALGDAYEGIANYDKAVNAYSTAMQYDSDDSGLKMDLAYCLAMKNDFDDALKLFREVLQDSPENTNAHLGMGRCYINMEMYADALPYLKQAVSLAPQNATTHKMLSEVHMGLGDEEEALKEAQLSLTLNPEPNIAEQAREIIDPIQHGPDETIHVERKDETDIRMVSAKAESWDLPSNEVGKIKKGEKQVVPVPEPIFQAPESVEEDKNLFCSNTSCNKAIPGDSVFCGYCGAKVVLS